MAPHGDWLGSIHLLGKYDLFKLNPKFNIFICSSVLFLSLLSLSLSFLSPLLHCFITRVHTEACLYYCYPSTSLSLYPSHSLSPFLSLYCFHLTLYQCLMQVHISPFLGTKTSFKISLLSHPPSPLLSLVLSICLSLDLRTRAIPKLQSVAFFWSSTNQPPSLLLIQLLTCLSPPGRCLTPPLYLLSSLPQEPTAGLRSSKQS